MFMSQMNYVTGDLEGLSDTDIELPCLIILFFFASVHCLGCILYQVCGRCCPLFRYSEPSCSRGGPHKLGRHSSLAVF